MIGCGGRSELAVEFHRPDLGAELVAAADPVQESGAKFSSKLEKERGAKPRLYADYREMLEKEHPDAVLIL